MLIRQLSEKGDQAFVAIIDEGIDIFHSAFLDSSGKTRIIALWDQNDKTGPSPQDYRRGTEYTQDDINRDLQTGVTRIGSRGRSHGTQVTSIASGSDIDDFIGVAPESKIIIVIPSTDRESHGFKLSHIEALYYIKSLAERHKMPVVVNISLGYNIGARDGTDRFEEECDKFSDHGKARGLIIVTSAGNERDKKSHIKLTIPDENPESIKWTSTGKHRRCDMIQVRFSTDMLMQFRLINPREEKSEWLSEGDNPDMCKFKSGDSYQLTYSHHPNGDSILAISISPDFMENTPIEKGLWILEIEKISEYSRNTNEVHAWIQSIGAIHGQPRPIEFINHISEEITLTIPSTAKNIISVGAVSSDQFRTTSYSSLGPTRARDNRPQPTLVAPGENILAALANNNNVRSCDITPVNGTSFAASYVTGAIALLLSARKKQCDSNSNLSQFNESQVKTIITRTSQNQTGQWSIDMGYGLLDVLKMLESISIFD
jgi:minor extracellular serine protease Vpr